MHGNKVWSVTGTKTVLIAVCSVWCGICMVFTHHCFSQMYHFRKAFFMKRWTRHEMKALWVFAECFIALRSFVVYQEYLIEDKQITHFTLYDRSIFVAAIFLPYSCITGMLAVFSLRLWHQYYSSQLAVKVGMAEWRSMIDESLVTEEMSWFLRHKHTYGNPSFLANIALSIWLVLITAVAIAANFFLAVNALAYPATVLSVSVFIGWCAFHYPPFKDEIALRTEKKILSIALMVLLVAWLSLLMFPAMVGWDWEKHPGRMVYCLLATQVFMGTALTVIAYILSLFVINQFLVPTKSVKVFGVTVPLAFDPEDPSISKHYAMQSRSPSLPRIPTSPIGRIRGFSGTSDLSSRVQLWHVLGSDDFFRAFMIHLFAEFSAENALCLIECTKFRQRMMELTSQKESNQNTSTDMSSGQGSTLDWRDQKRLGSEEDGISRLDFCNDIKESRSTLVSRLECLTFAPSVARDLYDRYIRDQAPYCVNLAWRDRHQMEQVLSVSSETDITVDTFNPVINACLRLLKESFSRFRSTQACQNLSNSLDL